MPIGGGMGMESSPIPGEDKLLLWNQAAFERRKDSDQKKELLKENLVVEMSVFAGKKAVDDPPCDVGFLFGRFFSFSFRLFWFRLILVGREGFITRVPIGQWGCPETVNKVVIRPQRRG